MNHFMNTFGHQVRKRSLEARRATHKLEALSNRLFWETVLKDRLRLKEMGYVQDLNEVEVYG